MFTSSGLVWGLLSVIAMFIMAAVIAVWLFQSQILLLPNATGQRIGAIDGLRGYLAIAVLAHHFPIAYRWASNGQWQTSGLTLFDNLGPVAVSCFFMITGLLFYKRFIVAEIKPAWMQFFANRFFRVAPVYYLAVMVTVFVVIATTGWLFANRDNTISILSWLLFTIHGPLPLNGFPAKVVTAGVFWTLRYEWAFYFSLPVLVLLFKPLRGRAALRLAVLAFGFITMSLLPFDVYGFQTSIVRAFLIGMITAEILESKLCYKYANNNIVSSFAVGAILSAIFLPLPAYGTISLLLIFVFFLASACGCTMFGLLSLRSSILLGEISYSIYALHGIVLFGFVFTSSSRLDPTEPWVWLALPSLASIVVMMSAITYRFVEQPGIKLGRRGPFSAQGTKVVHGSQAPQIE